ncbi:BlaI/MecI/CopY family transcriptional regulator [Candidatus Dojkabacteria bacterium]|uniref:BlaI/MecI/CopY family transcriptional regulator n=1 Tax=Candidatus Dojkabacteria bacterium TaxID=2099670 RepID=A0A955I9C4_9BACT|nr:BlaI/MecI/CopY family transcriptional regulator [Candidatus Dojkabacteria bacterium]
MNQVLGDLEEKIMKILWGCATPLKPSEVKCQLEGDYAYTTIMTVLARLNEKGILERKRKGKAYYYSPKNNKESFIKPKLKGIFTNIIDTYGNIAISQFVDVLETLKPEDIDKLKKYLDSKIDEDK